MMCKCAKCGDWFDRSVMEEHHVIPRALGGSDHYRVLLCRQCHAEVTRMFMSEGLIWYPDNWNRIKVLRGGF